MSDGVPREQRVLLEGYTASGRGTVTIVTYDRSARWRRALKALARCHHGLVLTLPAADRAA